MPHFIKILLVFLFFHLFSLIYLSILNSSDSFGVFQSVKTLVQLTCKYYKLFVLSWCIALFHLCLSSECFSLNQLPGLKCQNFP